MSKERDIEVKKAPEKAWRSFRLSLPDGLTPEQVFFLKRYYKAQVAISEGNFKGAYAIFGCLDAKEGYQDFEDNNSGLFAQIDLAVRGKTNRQPGG